MCKFSQLGMRRICMHAVLYYLLLVWLLFFFFFKYFVYPRQKTSLRFPFSITKLVYLPKLLLHLQFVDYSTKISRSSVTL
jgi:hypothetical protein